MAQKPYPLAPHIPIYLILGSNCPPPLPRRGGRGSVGRKESGDCEIFLKFQRTRNAK